MLRRRSMHLTLFDNDGAAARRKYSIGPRWTDSDDNGWWDRQDLDCATWLHKAREVPKEEFRREVEKELTGKETEP